MIVAVVGAGGKTTWIRRTAEALRAEGKRVFVTTTTRMYIEPETLLTDDPAVILRQLEQRGWVMAGRDAGKGKFGPLSPETYARVCAGADAVLVEADGAKHFPLKFPRADEPVIPDNADEILVIWGPHALGRPASEGCHRLELVKSCLGITDDTIITDSHVQTLLREGYVRPLKEKYPEKTIRILPGGRSR